MRPPKNPKKYPDEDRSRKKKIKSKSAHRRRDPSISSNSSSSESELNSRSRIKSSKSKKLEKRRKESKKSERRNSRKKRYRRDSSVSSFSSDSGGRRSCSTCSDSERSRSPVRKSKSRKREQERGRKSSQRRFESSPISRYRSRSCSTCSKSRSHSRNRSPIEGRFGSSWYRSQRCSTCSRSRSRSPIEERYGSGCPRSPLDEESPSIEERFGSSRGRSQYMKEGETKRLRSVLAVKKTLDEDEDKIIEVYADFPRSYEGYDDEGNKKRNLDVGNRESDSYGTRIREDETSSNDRGQPVKDSDVGGGATNNYSSGKESEVVGENGGKDADDLEMILRQKALENFRKFRGVRPVNREGLSDKKDESSKLESCQGSQSFMNTSESNPPSSLDDNRHVQGGIHPNKLKARSVAKIPTERIDGNALNDTGGFKPVVNSITNQNILNQFKRLQESYGKISSEKSSLTKDSQNKNIFALPDSGKVSRAEMDTADKPASDVLNAENQNCKANEPMVEYSSGSQFEQKTFSRECDGETVQVSYKVYIPKKTPALARRQLQR